MLKEFEVGKKYRIIGYEKLSQCPEVEVSDRGSLAYGALSCLYTIKMDSDVKDMIFKCDEGFNVKGDFVNDYFIEPWMCEEVNADIKTLSKYEMHMEICKKMNETYKNKNHDYGDSFGETFKKLGIISAITRITDKVNRLQSLTTQEQKVKDESIKDTLLDAANYCIMTLIELENEEGE